jgi:hypothetical protein
VILSGQLFSWSVGKVNSEVVGVMQLPWNIFAVKIITATAVLKILITETKVIVQSS